MKTYELIAPCHFGLEAVLKREIDDLGYDISKTEDGRVTFIGDMEALCRANVFLRSAERILLKAGSFLQGKHIFADCGACIDESRQFSGKDI